MDERAGARGAATRRGQTRGGARARPPGGGPREFQLGDVERTAVAAGATGGAAGAAGGSASQSRGRRWVPEGSSCSAAAWISAWSAAVSACRATMGPRASPVDWRASAWWWASVSCAQCTAACNTGAPAPARCAAKANRVASNRQQYRGRGALSIAKTMIAMQRRVVKPATTSRLLACEPRRGGRSTGSRGGSQDPASSAGCLDTHGT